MSHDMYIKAFIPDTDPEYQRQRKVLLACKEAEVSLPKETAKFFGENYADLSSLDEKLEIKLQKDLHYREIFDDGVTGYEVILSKLPAGVDRIQFINTW